MFTIITFIFVLGVLVFVHEFGHFIVAKWAGVRVERFSLGFGPTIIERKVGETVYQVAWIPLGGYVKMSGEEASDLERGYDEKEDSATESIPEDRLFNKKPLGKRLAIVIAGPVMNIFMALLLLPIVYMSGIEVDASLYEPARIGYVEPTGAAGKAGIQAGDRIAKIDGREMPNWKKAKAYILFHPNRELQVEIDRSGSTMIFPVRTDLLESLGGGTLGVFPEWASRIKTVFPGKPAAEAGMQAGDLIVALDDLKHPHWMQTQQYIQSRPDQKIQVVVERSGAPVTLEMTPRSNPEIENRGFVGIEPDQPVEMRRFPFLQALRLGVEENLENTTTTLAVVGKLLSGGLKIKAVGGPVQIAEFTGAAASEGLSSLLHFMAFISLQLAILNLLPIPVLDGGHILFMLIEGIKGKPLSLKFRILSQQVGMAMLLTLMAVVTFNDLVRLREPIEGFIRRMVP